MILVVTVIILLACIVLGFFVLIQNPKGGGLAGSFGSIGSQVMGVKQSSDVMEKGTWISMSIVAVLCIVSVMWLQKPQVQPDARQKQSTQQQQSSGQQQQPAGGQQPAK
jgi:preprotein translocase subunit SecG